MAILFQDDMTGLVFLLKKYQPDSVEVPIRRKVRTMPASVSAMIQEPNVMYTYPVSDFHDSKHINFKLHLFLISSQICCSDNSCNNLALSDR